MRLVRLPPEAMQALLDGDTAAASTAAGVELGGYLAGADSAWLWRVRLAQIAEDPRSAHWVARAAVADPGGVVVGHAGFHGPPDSRGLVEVGYSVDPGFRRQGYARAMVRALLEWAGREDGVRVVRACISPDNAASLATIAGFGFEKVGAQWDEVDGLESIFERDLTA